MTSELPSKEDMHSLIKQECEHLSSKEKAYVENILVPLQKKTLKWEYGNLESYEAWVFADFQERKVGAAYCLRGFGGMGSPWGLIFFDSCTFGMDCGWYPTLKELIQDGWVENEV